MAGVMRNEGTPMALRTFPQYANNLTEDSFIKLALAAFEMELRGADPKNITDYYLENVFSINPQSLWKAFNDIYGDILMTCPTYQFAKQFSQNTPKSNVFFYELTYQSSKPFLHECDGNTMSVCHASDVTSVFGLPLTEPQNSRLQIERDFSRQILKFWITFAKTGYK